MKRAGEIMLQNVGADVDTGTLLQLCTQQANSEMTEQWAKFYAMYSLLGGWLLNALRGCDWEEAIDTLMGWSGNLRPFLGLRAFLQGYWQDEHEESGVPPKVLPVRVMCWVYEYPERWETVERTMEMAGVHEAALRHGKVVTHALRQQWRGFAGEIARHAKLLKKRKNHETKAEATLKHCKRL